MQFFATKAMSESNNQQTMPCELLRVAQPDVCILTASAMETDEEDGMLKVCAHPGCKAPTAHYPKAVCVKHAPRAVFAPSRGDLEVARIAGDNWLDNPRIRIVTPVILNSKFYTDLRELSRQYCVFTTGPFVEDATVPKLDHLKYGDRKTSLQYWVDKEGKPLFKTGNTLTLSQVLTLLSHNRARVWFWFWLWFQLLCQCYSAKQTHGRDQGNQSQDGRQR